MSTSSNTLLLKNLMEFGLSEKEAKVYLALLELEVAQVSEVAKTANINRSSTYVVLESLKRKGLVSVSEDKKVQQYVAVSPEMLLQEAKDKAKRVEDVKNKIDDIIPELKALHRGTKQKPKVKIYEGAQGLISCFEETLHSKDKIMRAVSSPGNLENLISNYIVHYVSKRTIMGIKMLGIHPDDKIHRGYIENNPKTIDEYILIPKEKYKFPADFAIWDNKVGFMSGENGGYGISIENDALSEVMKNIFDLAFDEAKHIGQKVSGYELKKRK